MTTGLNVNRMVTECFTEKLTFEQRPEGDRRSQPHRYLGKPCFAKRKSTVNSEMEVGLGCSGNRKEASVLEWSEQSLDKYLEMRSES